MESGIPKALERGNPVDVTCKICGKQHRGYAFNTMDDLMAVSSKIPGHEYVALICNNCGAVFCFDHKKEIGWKIWDGFERVNCPECYHKLKKHKLILDLDPDEVTKMREATPSAPADKVPVVEKPKYTGIAGDIWELAQKGEHEKILNCLLGNMHTHGNDIISKPEIEKVLREVMAGYDDEEQIKEWSNTFRYGPANANGVVSAMLMSFTGHPSVVELLLGTYKNYLGSGGSINQVSAEGVVETCLEEIGIDGLDDMLKAMVTYGNDARVAPFIGQSIRKFITEENRHLLEPGLLINDFFGRLEVTRILVEKGWEPEATTEKALVLMGKDDIADLEAMGAEIEPLLIEMLGFKDLSDFIFGPYKPVMEVLGKIGGEDAATFLIDQLAEGTSAPKKVVEALTAIGDPRAVKAILTHADTAKGLKALNANNYAKALASFGEAARPELEAALSGDRKLKRIAEKALKSL